MCKIKSWVVDEKKHVRYHEWNDKEVEIFFLIIFNIISYFFAQIEVFIIH